jgi:hypothetical protein
MRLSGPDIFLSYARADRAVARVFAEAFVAEGFTVWWDASLHSGETFDEVIEKNLRDSKAVVVLWSPRSVASRWVRAEATQADRRNKLVPAIIEQCDRPIIFELTHTAELSGWSGDRADVHWRMFMEDLRRMTDRSSAAAAAAAASPELSVSARKPIRPGSDEVINAMPRVPAGPALSGAAAKLHAVEHAEGEHDDEVHGLQVEDADLGEDMFPVESGSVKIGRTPPADIVLAHKSISREHCVIGLANDELLVTDLSSTNGTFVDGARVLRTTLLPVGSVLTVGQVTLRHVVVPRDQAGFSGEFGGLGHGLGPGRIAAAR